MVVVNLRQGLEGEFQKPGFVKLGLRWLGVKTWSWACVEVSLFHASVSLRMGLVVPQG